MGTDSKGRYRKGRGACSGSSRDPNSQIYKDGMKATEQERKELYATSENGHLYDYKTGKLK